jgi:FkbM family methyltransferase
MKLPLTLAAAAARLLPTSLKKAIYRSGPLARLIRRALNRSAPNGLSQVTVAAGGLQGAKLLIDMRMKKNYWLGTYEPELQQAVHDWLRPGMVVFDAGANVGYISLLLARTVQANSSEGAGQVFAFEPLPANLERMAANFALNPWAKITTVAAAVVDQPGPVRFLAHASGAMGKAAGSAGRQNETYLAEITVDGITLDQFVYGERPQTAPPQAIKMDIEGGEVLALKGMRRLLAEARPLLLIELHGPESARTAWETLTAANYQILRMEPGYPPVSALADLNWKAYIVAIPNNH